MHYFILNSFIMYGNERLKVIKTSDGIYSVQDSKGNILSYGNKFSTYGNLKKDKIIRIIENNDSGNLDKTFEILRKLNEIAESFSDGLSLFGLDNNISENESLGKEEDNEFERLYKDYYEQKEGFVDGKSYSALDLGDFKLEEYSKNELMNFNKEYRRYLDGNEYRYTFFNEIEGKIFKILDKEGKEVGMIAFQMDEGDLFLSIIVIKERFSGNGIGSSVILNLLKKLKAKSLSGEIIDSDNGYSYNFYKSLKRKVKEIGVRFSMHYQ